MTKGQNTARSRKLVGNQYINPFSSLRNLGQIKKYNEKETGVRNNIS
jgi:hypothetical protein